MACPLYAFRLAPYQQSYLSNIAQIYAHRIATFCRSDPTYAPCYASVAPMRHSTG